MAPRVLYVLIAAFFLAWAAVAPSALAAGSEPPAHEADDEEGKRQRQCYVAGFCGVEGWAYGTYKDTTRESSGCTEIAPGGVDHWARGVSHVPLLPKFAESQCTFFYHFSVCSLPSFTCRS